MNQSSIDLAKAHQFFSASCFNEAWDYIEKTDRDARDTEQMLCLAYASLYHWTQREDQSPSAMSIGYWQLARIHVLAGHLDMARHHAEQCIQVSEANQLEPFYLAYGYEALARVDVAAGHANAARDLLQKANVLAEALDAADQREALLADLATLNPQGEETV